MTRRVWVGIPGMAALAARRMFAQDSQAAVTVSQSPQHVSKKSLIQYARLKAAYKIPKNAGKEAKHLASLTALLSLTAAQQQQASAIFNSAVGSRASLHTSLKAAHQSLSQAVQNNDTGGIGQAAAAIANLKAQQVSSGAMANAAFLQILTAGQKATLGQLRS